MAKLLLIPVLVVCACLIAGTYGALHNQVSYTVAPEYFTQFKFHQFRIAENLPHRVGAAIVGWFAAWWMGLLIGGVLIPCGLSIRGTGAYVRGVLQAFGIVVLVALVMGLGALLIATLTLSDGDVGEFIRYGNEIEDDLSFARAGTMHDFSYLGGAVGFVCGLFWIFVVARRSRRVESSPVSRVEE